MILLNSVHITIFCKCGHSLRSLHQSYIDLESETHFMTHLLSFSAYSNLLKRCFAKGLVTFPRVLSNPIGKIPPWICTSKLLHTLPFSKKDSQRFEYRVQKADLLSGTKHYYCIVSRQCEINMIIYALMIYSSCLTWKSKLDSVVLFLC